MKKYLMTGVAALAICAAFTSCSKSGEDVYNPEAAGQMKAEQITQAYNEAFVAYIGGPVASNQDWGFGSAGTRTVVKSDMTDYPTEKAPAAITDFERTYVTQWFQDDKNKGLSDKGKDWSEFFIQWVSGDFYNKKGVWHRYDQNRVNNGYDSNYYDEDFTDNAVMDYLIVSDNKGYTEHVLDFNSNSGGPNSIVYMKNSSALYFGYHSSWDSNDYQYFKLAEIDVPGVGKGWYVGLSVYGKKYDNGDKELGIQRLQYAEDWILKIVPGETTPPPSHNYTLRVLGEDLTLGEDTDADFDFNDVVFDVAIENGETWIRLQAAGGTLPLYIDGKEVHQLFGVNPTDMVNTGKGPKKDPVEVKLDNYYSNAKNIPITVTKNGTTIALKAEKGEPASKIAVNDINFKWCGERVSIKKEYTYFTQWCTANNFKSSWWEQ